MATNQWSLPPDFVDLFRSFVDCDVRFLVVGAYAVSVHGHPRSTKDIDIWIDATPENAKKVHAALKAFGAPIAALKLEDLSRPGIVFQMGVAPVRIDILTSITGVTFAEAWPMRVEIEEHGMNIGVIGSDHLLQNKRATARPHDLEDVAAVEKVLEAARRGVP